MTTLTFERRAGRRAASGQRPLALRRHRQCAGTASVRLQLAKPARAPSEGRATYPSTGGLQ
jgi:hypothetical protein